MTVQPTPSEKEFYPISWTEALKASFTYWFKDLRRYLPLYLLPQGAMIILVYVLLFVSGFNPWLAYIVSFVAPIGSVDLLTLLAIPIDFITLLYLLGFVLIMVFYTVVGVLFSATVIKHSWDRFTGQEPTLGSSFSFAKTRFISLLGVTFLVTALSIGISGVMLGPLLLGLLSGLWLVNPILFLAIILGALVGSFILIFVILYVQTRWAVFSGAVVLGGLRAVESLRQSWNLTRGRFWGTFGFNLILSMMISGITGALVTMQAFFIFLPMPPFFPILYSVGYAIALSFASPLTSVGQAMYYQHVYSEVHGAFPKTESI